MKKFVLGIIFSVCLCNLALAQYDKEVFMWRGRQALSDGRYALAIENFNVLTHIDSTDYWGFFFRGIAKYNLGDLRGAYKDFNTSVHHNPVFTNGYHYRAIAASRMGNYDEAFKDFEKALELRPGQIGIYFSRGVSYFLAQHFEDAVRDFDYYIKREPKDPGAYLNRGASHLFLADTTKALNDYNKAIKLDRFEPEGYIRRARIYAAKSMYDEAITDFNKAIELDSSSTFAHFNRALLYNEVHRYNDAMADLNKVLSQDPGNALTLYNRGLIYAQMGDFEKALEDMDRVININPRNVLAHYNRAAVFVEMERWMDALSDYNRAIELYPDFAKAYLNRSFVEQKLGRMRESKADYRTAQEKVRNYRDKSGEASFADTTKKYSALLAFDADFAQKNFDNELLQHRDVDIQLRPLYRFSVVERRENRSVALSSRYENALLDRFLDASPLPLTVSNTATYAAHNPPLADGSESFFAKALLELQDKKFNSALSYLDLAVENADSPETRDKYANYYKAFYLMNRAVLRAEMIDFIASLEGNVQTLSMDTDGAARARVSDRVARDYDYSEAIADLNEALEILPDIPFLYFNLANLHCLSSQYVSAIESYDMATRLYPNMGDAFFNRGLVLIYLRDNEKGCIDLSRAGELGVADAYRVIAKYCDDEKY